MEQRLSRQFNRTGLYLNCSENETDLKALFNVFVNHAYLPPIELRELHIVTMVIALPLVIFTGIIFNILSIWILSRDKRYNPSIFLLQALAVADTLFLLLNALFFALPVMIIHWFGIGCELDNYVVAIADADSNSVGRQIAQITQTVRILAVGMIVLVTVDRYIALFYPLHAQRFCTFGATRKLIALLFFYGLTWFVVLKLVDSKVFNIKAKNRTFALGNAINLIIPAVVIFVLNIKLIVNIRDTKRQLRAMGSERNRTNDEDFREFMSLTVKLIAVASTFLICAVPGVIQSVNMILAMEWRYDCCIPLLSIDIMNYLSILLMNFNSSVNFFLYVSTGGRFRRDLNETFQHICGRRYKAIMSYSHSRKNYRTECESASTTAIQLCEYPT
ncbi:FMRFamide receptor-like [Lineus longissimus]|uniref:FMRFamide receptor-like n=1 Tax=Lineus longissimus TaxID=88925 RepID=UPI002B4D987B